MTENKWVTPKQLSKELNVSKQVMNNWMARGKIKWKIEPKYDIRLVDRTSLLVNIRPKKAVNGS